MHTYLSISRGIPATKCACDNDNHLFVFKVASVVVLHTLKLCRKNTTKHIVDDVGIVTGTSSLSGIEDGGLDSALVVLTEDTSSVTHQPGQLRERSRMKRVGGRKKGRGRGREREGREGGGG